MASGKRKHYIDNIRWIMLLILIPYHTAMAWNVWGESNYVFFEGNRAISSIIVFFSLYFMPLLFVLAGISAKYALQKRTVQEFIIERVKRLLIPFLFGTIILMPVMSYIADKFNCSYGGGFFGHYAVFFTKYTDLTGADGGFSVGQFWFLLYLFIISVVTIGAVTIIKKIIPAADKTIPFWLVFLFGFPLPLLSEWLSIGGKSLLEYTYLFIMGYFIFSDAYFNKNAKRAPMGRIIFGLLTSPDYSVKDFKAIMKNGYADNTTLWKELLDIDLTPRLAELKIRYFLLQGETDIITSTANVLKYVENSKNKNLSVKVIENSGHMPSAKAMDECFRALLQFIS